MAEYLFECLNASFGYDGLAAVCNLNFKIKTGDYISIVGENGCGKSTLIKGLLRLIKPIDGAINFCDVKKNEVGYLSQQSEAKNDFPASVNEIVISGFLGKIGVRPFYLKEEKLAAEQNMEKLDIIKIRNACFRELSGGQQRRVLLARALCAAQKLLILDEPAAGLDPIVTNEVYSLLKKINNDITIIIVSHDIESALKYSTGILHLKQKQIFFGTTNEYKNSTVSKYFYNKESDCG